MYIKIAKKKPTDVYLFPRPVGEGLTFELTFLLQHKSEENIYDVTLMNK